MGINTKRWSTRTSTAMTNIMRIVMGIKLCTYKKAFWPDRIHTATVTSPLNTATHITLMPTTDTRIDAIQVANHCVKSSTLKTGCCICNLNRRGASPVLRLNFS